MRRFRLFTFIKDGFKGVFRNGLMSVASIFVLFSSLFVIGVFTTLIYNVNYNLEGMQDFKELVCYLELDATDEQRKTAQMEIENFENVKRVTFVSKEEALRQEREKYGNNEESKIIFEMYDNGRQNPLPDAFRIEYNSMDSLSALEENIRRVYAGRTKEEGPVVSSVRNTYEIAHNIENLKNIVTIGGTWLMVLLAIVSVFVIANTIKITYHSRELEIGIMRYIGATKFYITMPFVFESIIISLVSAGLGYLAQWYLYTGVVEVIQQKYEIIKIVPFGELQNLFLIIYFGVALFIGIFGSIITIRKYMKV